MPGRLLFLGIAAVAVVVAAGAASSSSVAPPALQGPPQVLVQFGYVKSLKPSGDAFELRFDAAQWLGGVTARRAAVEDGAIRQEPVPNDYYILNPDRRLTTYRVPRNVPVTVVTTAGGLGSTRVGVAELAEIVNGRNPKRRSLLDRRNFLGFWLRTRVDTVHLIDQQYQP